MVKPEIKDAFIQNQWRKQATTISDKPNYNGLSADANVSSPYISFNISFQICYLIKSIASLGQKHWAYGYKKDKKKITEEKSHQTIQSSSKSMHTGALKCNPFDVRSGYSTFGICMAFIPSFRLYLRSSYPQLNLMFKYIGKQCWCINRKIVLTTILQNLFNEANWKIYYQNHYFVKFYTLLRKSY